MSTRVLVVDDDPVQRRLLDAMLRKLDYDPVLAEGGEQGLAVLDASDRSSIGCIVLDLVMPEMDGFTFLQRLRERGIDLPVLVQTAQGSIDTVVTAMRAGATDFVVKPVGIERIQVSLRNALSQAALAGEVRRIQRTAEGALALNDLSSASARMQQTLKLAEKAAASEIPVLIEGESGVGKELIARAIRGAGTRRNKPFIAVNCGAIPANLVESILFGHEKGAFTGATERTPGKFVEADGGTLFLDEIGELPADTQVKLLRALQDGEIDPVGGRKPMKVDFRLISATNRDLLQLVRAGKFREDLFYRLHIFPITVPPLRDRMEDLPDLVRRFVARFAAEEGKRVRAVSSEAMRLLAAYRWPGNVRQLENAVFRAVVLAETDEIGVREFPQIATQVPGYEAYALPAGPSPQKSPEPHPEPLVVLADSPATVPGTANGTAADALPLLGADGHVRPMETVEADTIRFAIERYRGRMTEVARRLKIGRSTLYRKLKDLGLDGDAEGEEASNESSEAALRRSVAIK